MGSNNLNPAIGNRLDAWVKIQDRVKSEGVSAKGKCITISREFGCEGFPLAEELQKMLKETTGVQWAIFDRKLFEVVSENENISKKFFENFDTPSHHLDIVSGLLQDWKTGAELFEMLSKSILELAENGNCIIIGRGGAVLTKNFKNCTHVRIEGSMEFRTRSVMQRNALSESEARSFIRDGEDERLTMLKKFLNCENINDMAHFHLKLNNEKMNVKQMAQTILSLI